MDYLEKVHEAINEFVTRYQNNPFDFLYEADIQGILFSIIFKKFETERITLRGGYVSNKYPRVDSIKTIPVKCEYPTPKGHISKTGDFDIAVINPSHLIHFDSEKAKLKGWKSDPFWNQDLRIAIEIKYCQLSQDPCRKAKEAGKDIDKLSQYQFHSSNSDFLGIVLIFVQHDSININPFLVGKALEEENAQPSKGVYKYIITPSRWLKFIA